MAACRLRRLLLGDGKPSIIHSMLTALGERHRRLRSSIPMRWKVACHLHHDMLPSTTMGTGIGDAYDRNLSFALGSFTVEKTSLDLRCSVLGFCAGDVRPVLPFADCLGSTSNNTSGRNTEPHLLVGGEKPCRLKPSAFSLFQRQEGVATQQPRAGLCEESHLHRQEVRPSELENQAASHYDCDDDGDDDEDAQ